MLFGIVLVDDVRFGDIDVIHGESETGMNCCVVLSCRIFDGCDLLDLIIADDVTFSVGNITSCIIVLVESVGIYDMSVVALGDVIYNGVDDVMLFNEFGLLTSDEVATVSSDAYDEALTAAERARDVTDGDVKFCSLAGDK